MSAVLIDSSEKGRVAYDSLVVSDPAKLSALNNKISLKIIKVLSEKPSCAIDIARKLKVHEQKIYYHLKNLKKAGIIYKISQERRHGMIANMYTVVSPVISAKLFEKGSEVMDNFLGNLPSSAILNFLSPFIENGKLDAKIIIADPHPHGKYDFYGREAAHLSDLLLFLGKFIKELEFPTYKLDTETTKEDLEDNLILIGNAKTNTIIEKLNHNLPIEFDTERESITSSRTKTVYKDDRIGFVIKTRNPHNPKKYILLISSITTGGIMASIIYILKYIGSKIKTFGNTDEVVSVIEGLDRDGDKIIDDIKILEEHIISES
jgi:DNA-binding transcriptional ArsR family regulator